MGGSGMLDLPVSPAQWRIHPSPSGPAWAVWRIGTPREGVGYERPSHPPPHIATYTPESLRSCLGRLGDRDAPWGGQGRVEIQYLPAQWRTHPSPSGPAWGIGAPRGGHV